MKLERQDVLRVAELANLQLTEDEITSFGRQLSDILTYISKLNELDTSATPPMAQVMAAGASPNPTVREDAARECRTAAEILPGAPDASGPYFRVPKVVERSE
jgi:aspartyl-tRNA(Asn)/glutamyl-tRNA(Gln) amidotransferase subunit C